MPRRSLGVGIITALLVVTSCRPAAPLPRDPYSDHAISLKGKSEDEIFRFMGHGKTQEDFRREHKPHTHVCDGFWSMPPKDAALATVETNRSEDHRNRYKLTIDNLDATGPPDTCSVAYEFRSSRCFIATDLYFFLRCDPKDSYLIAACVQGGGVVYHDPVSPDTSWQFRRCKLPYETARQAAQMIWWLDRVHSAGVQYNGFMTSTADGHGHLEIHADVPGHGMTADETLWMDPIAARWRGHFDHETALNIASYVIETALPERLGNAWAPFTFSYLDSTGAPPRENVEAASACIGEILKNAAADERRISFELIGAAAGAAGDLMLGEHQASLVKISAELTAMRRGSMPALNAPEAQHRELRVGNAQLAADTALKQLAMLNDPAALETAAAARGSAGRWAASRLKSLDPARYGSLLEAWLKTARGEDATQIFSALMEADPVRARAYGESHPLPLTPGVRVAAFAAQAKAGTMPDLGKHVKELIEIVGDPASGWEARSRAIACLAPAADPRRYPDESIDRALLECLEPAKADDGVNFVFAHAMLALARRDGARYFDTALKKLAAMQEPFVFTDALAAVTSMAQAGGAKEREALAAFLRPNLVRSDKMLESVFWSIWAADLRSLLPDLERIATVTPEEYEGARAQEGGGEPTDVTKGRYHMARRIAAIWREPDALTRGKLLIAFGLAESHWMVDSPEAPGPRRRMTDELTRLAGTLSETDRQVLWTFAGDRAGIQGGLQEPSRATRFAEVVRELLGIQALSPTRPPRRE